MDAVLGSVSCPLPFWEQIGNKQSCKCLCFSAQEFDSWCRKYRGKYIIPYRREHKIQSSAMFSAISQEFHFFKAQSHCPEKKSSNPMLEKGQIACDSISLCSNATRSRNALYSQASYSLMKWMVDDSRGSFLSGFFVSSFFGMPLAVLPVNRDKKQKSWDHLYSSVHHLSHPSALCIVKMSLPFFLLFADKAPS